MSFFGSTKCLNGWKGWSPDKDADAQAKETGERRGWACKAQEMGVEKENEKMNMKYIEIGNVLVLFSDGLKGIEEIRILENGKTKSIGLMRMDKWLKDHPEVATKADAALKKRQAMAEKWKKRHWVGNYSADCGHFRLRVNGAVIDIVNEFGDCMDAPVYVVTEEEDILPPDFHRVAGVKGLVEVLDYDSDAVKANVVVMVENPEIWCGWWGEMALRERMA